MSGRVALCGVMLAAALSGACWVGALHPAYNDRAIVFEEGLIGTWSDADSEISIRVERGEWRSYRIAFTDRTGTTRFTGHLTTIGTALVLNVRPEDGLERPAFLVVSNGIAQVIVGREDVRIRELSYDEIAKELKARTLTLPAATDLKQNVLITADTQALRGWLAAAVKVDRLWADWKTLSRS